MVVLVIVAVVFSCLFCCLLLLWYDDDYCLQEEGVFSSYLCFSWYHAGFDVEPDIDDESLVPVERLLAKHRDPKHLCAWGTLGLAGFRLCTAEHGSCLYTNSV